MGDRLKGKVAIVTGAGSSGPGWGNGKATAALFAREGAKVFGVDLNPDAVEETANVVAAEKGVFTAHVADVSQPLHWSLPTVHGAKIGVDPHRQRRQQPVGDSPRP